MPLDLRIPVLPALLTRSKSALVRRPVAVVLAACFLSTAPTAPVWSQTAATPPLYGAEKPAIERPLTGLDTALYNQALAAADSGRWQIAAGLARRSSDPYLADLINWMWARKSGRDEMRIDQRLALIERQSDWPFMDDIQAKAEEQAFEIGTARPTMEGFFAKHPPVSWAGKALVASYLKADGDQAGAEALAREAWIEADLSPPQEQQFVAVFGSMLDEATHIARMDRLLWDNHSKSADRLLPRLSEGYQALAKARMILRNGGGDPNRAIAAIPKDLRSDPGLIYERARWRRRNNLASGALELHLGDAAQPGVTQTGNQKAWWTERAILARAAIRRGDYRTAYRLASGHGSTHSGSRAEAEWIAGWVALRFQKQPDTAFKHFTTLFENVSTPISLSRGAYWAGRSLAAKGDTAGAEAWYRKAAQYPNAFYGQLAIDHLGESLSNYWPKTDVVPTAEDYAAVAADSRAQTAARLAQTGRNQELLSFLLKLEADVESPGARVLIGDIALREGHLGEAVFYARRAALDGTLLLAAGYPMDPDLTAALIEASAENGLEPALVMGLIRQESNFNPIVVSPAGARGLMQIMPATAQIVARQVKLPYSRDKLTADPSFNIVLGTKYLGDLMKQFGGSEILSAAGYNAGPGRPIQWMDRNGDPRRAQVDTLDWIEKIPFNETRNYVQRVLEGMWAFRQRLGSPEALQPATADF